MARSSRRAWIPADRTRWSCGSTRTAVWIPASVAVAWRRCPRARTSRCPVIRSARMAIGIAGGGRIVAGGNFENTGVEVDAALWAFTSGGSPETGFSGGTGTVRGPTGAFEACALAVAPDGSLVVAGATVPTFPDKTPCAVNGSATGFVARYGGFGAPPPPPPPPPTTATTTAAAGGVHDEPPRRCQHLQDLRTSQRYRTEGRGQLQSGVHDPGIACSERSHGQAASLSRRPSRGAPRSRARRIASRSVSISRSRYASANGSLKGSGTTVITLKLHKRYVNTLKKQRSVSVTLQVSSTATVRHRTKTITKRLTFKG